jgi:F0F1-type ATP synthase assembly protein I
MPAVKSFLTDTVSKVRGSLEKLSEHELPADRATDSRYRSEAEHNLKAAEKHFVWSEVGKVLTMMMSAVLMGGVTGTIVKMAAGTGFAGMGVLTVVGIGLAAAAVGAAYISFKSYGRTNIDVAETNARMHGRVNAEELAPAIAKTVGQEVRVALKDVVSDMRSDHRQAMIAGAANTNTTVDAAVVDADAAHMPIPTLTPAKEPTLPEPTLIVSPLDSKNTPKTRTHATPEVTYEGKGVAPEASQELANLRG